MPTLTPGASVTYPNDRELTPLVVAPGALMSEGSSTFRVVEVTLRVWDRHMDQCAECLREGQHLCFEGEYLTEKVVEAREKVRVHAARSERVSAIERLLRPALPGVGA